MSDVRFYGRTQRYDLAWRRSGATSRTESSRPNFTAGSAKSKDSKSALPVSTTNLPRSTPVPAARSTSEPPPYQQIRGDDERIAKCPRQVEAGVSHAWLYAQTDELRDHPSADHSTRLGQLRNRANRTRIRGLAATTPHPRTRTHPRIRQRQPSTPRPDRPPTRAAPRQTHRQHPRHGHRPRRKHPGQPAEQPIPPKITIVDSSSRHLRRSSRISGRHRC